MLNFWPESQVLPPGLTLCVKCKEHLILSLYVFPQVIDAIASAIASTEECNLLDVDPGPSTNRTVYTFVGTPEGVVEGALNAARVAAQLIDMRRHSGIKCYNWHTSG